MLFVDICVVAQQLNSVVYMLCCHFFLFLFVQCFHRSIKKKKLCHIYSWWQSVTIAGQFVYMKISLFSASVRSCSQLSLCVQFQFSVQDKNKLLCYYSTPNLSSFLSCMYVCILARNVICLKELKLQLIFNLWSCTYTGSLSSLLQAKYSLLFLLLC